MDRQIQIDLLKRTFDLIEKRSTDMLPELFRNPASDYTCREQLAREKEQFFRNGPVMVGLSGDAPGPGDWFTFDLLDIPLLIARDEEGVLHAFLNACRHRGMRVAEERGSGKKRFVCPYHSWSYKLNGCFNSRPFEEGFQGSDHADLGLRKLPLIEQHGLIFVRPSPGDPIDAAAVFAGLEQDIASFGLERYVPFEARDQKRKMNWKLGVDTFLEIYHIHHLHRDSIKPLFQNNRSLFDAYGNNTRLVAIRESISELYEQPANKWDLVPHSTIIYQLFPNTVLIYQLDHLEIYQLFPAGDDPNYSLARLSLYAPDPITSDSATRHWKNNIDLVDHVTSVEDFTACEAIQRSCATGMQEYLLFGRNEPGLIHYHRTLRSQLGLSQ